MEESPRVLMAEPEQHPQSTAVNSARISEPAEAAEPAKKTDAFMDRIEMRMQNPEATLKSLENQVGQISKVLNSGPIGGFPSDTEVLRVPPMSNADISTSVNEDYKHSSESKEEKNPAITPHIKLPKTDKLEEIRRPPPFPQRLKKQKQDLQFKKFFDILKQVHINLPLVEAL
ncbi:hypothetical protein V6N11_028741 [Hibiscus sabdariffa]|uniref:Uncharacterized protein n=1 Tax=Hibiscus sabdariffa TaxID=183260 RepID=A0ABR2PRI5_9ROSI